MEAGGEGEDIKGMFKTMMTMMESVKLEVAGMRGEFAEVKKTAEEASSAAQNARTVGEQARDDVKKLSEPATTNASVQEMINVSIAKAKESGLGRIGGP